MLLEGIRFTMWINSVVIAQTIFYSIELNPDRACYFKLRGWEMIIVQLCCVAVMFIALSVAMVPRYSICAILARTPKATVDKVVHDFENTLAAMQLDMAKASASSPDAMSASPGLL